MLTCLDQDPHKLLPNSSEPHNSLSSSPAASLSFLFPTRLRTRVKSHVCNVFNRELLHLRRDSCIYSCRASRPVRVVPPTCNVDPGAMVALQNLADPLDTSRTTCMKSCPQWRTMLAEGLSGERRITGSQRMRTRHDSHPVLERAIQTLNSYVHT